MDIPLTKQRTHLQSPFQLGLAFIPLALPMDLGALLCIRDVDVADHVRRESSGARRSFWASSGNL